MYYSFQNRSIWVFMCRMALRKYSSEGAHIYVWAIISTFRLHFLFTLYMSLFLIDAFQKVCEPKLQKREGIQ